ncbi:MAG TPA: S8 family serine peptidase [Trueperaceae bacterium]
MSSTANKPTQDSQYVPGQLLIRYRVPDSPSPLSTTKRLYRQTATDVAQAYNLHLLEPGVSGADLVSVPAGQDVRALAAQLERDPRVEYAEPNYYLHALEVRPNDPYYSYFGGRQWNMSDFGLPEAWEIEEGDSAITVAIIDAGVATGHEEFTGRILPGYDFCGTGADLDGDGAADSCTAPDNDPNPGGAGNSHGTHVTGIAAANGNNLVGVAGVAFSGVKILPVKVFDDSGAFATTAEVADAIRWAAGVDGTNRYPARILNLSLGAPGSSSALNDAVSDARNAGALVIAASGNYEGGPAINTGIFMPANAPGAIAVGSIDDDCTRSDFSYYDDTGGKTVALMAPGGYGPSGCSSVLSTIPENKYGCMAGTSMAAPFVSGVAALVWSHHPDWTADQVEAKLLSSTYFDPLYMNSDEYGNGIICADRALGASTLCGQ